MLLAKCSNIILAKICRLLSTLVSLLCSRACLEGKAASDYLSLRRFNADRFKACVQIIKPLSFVKGTAVLRRACVLFLVEVGRAKYFFFKPKFLVK